METLIRLRRIELLTFALGGATAAYAVVSRDEAMYLIAAAVCFVGMTGFLATESFGRLARARSRATRWIARFILVPSSVVSVVAIFASAQWILDR